MQLGKLSGEKMKHTAGPWKTCGAERGGCRCCLVWSTPVDVIVATAILAVDEVTGGEGVLLDEAKANARLIAAAPDLLECCKVLREIVQRDIDGDPDRIATDGHREDAADKAAFAIAKATETEGEP